ncbi:unnamed protein product [Brachionus calyciflorus]|uniref:Uncharacterized protein n=1 Tax=Brachionus calyciflorus TaxID=104777 RepID=A0A814N4M0_9BILA|nr:unnamed protein product [Brachionus calyciflorus]
MPDENLIEENSPQELLISKSPKMLSKKDKIITKENKAKSKKSRIVNKVFPNYKFFIYYLFFIYLNTYFSYTL